MANPAAQVAWWSEIRDTIWLGENGIGGAGKKTEGWPGNSVRVSQTQAAWARGEKGVKEEGGVERRRERGEDERAEDRTR